MRQEVAQQIKIDKQGGYRNTIDTRQSKACLKEKHFWKFLLEETCKMIAVGDHQQNKKQKTRNKTQHCMARLKDAVCVC